MSPDVSDEISDMPSSASASNTGSCSGSGMTADEVVEPASTFWRFDGRSIVSSSWISSSYEDSIADDNGESGGE